MSIASKISSGQGGLKFIAQSPPGQGRLVRIPFYLQTDQSNANFRCLVAGQALQNSSQASPVIAAGFNAAGTSPSVLLKTPEISWATLRLVGFESSVNFPPNPQGAVNTAAPDTSATAYNVVNILFKNLQIGGGATLFVHEDYAPSSIYDSHNTAFAGLRDYPLIKSPNVAQVEVAAYNMQANGSQPAAGGSYAAMASNVIFSCSLICSIVTGKRK